MFFMGEELWIKQCLQTVWLQILKKQKRKQNKTTASNKWVAPETARRAI
jgi:hypothetical protein